MHQQQLIRGFIRELEEELTFLAAIEHVFVSRTDREKYQHRLRNLRKGLAEYRASLHKLIRK